MTNIETIGNIASIHAGYQLRSKPMADEHGDTFLIRTKDVHPSRTKLMPENALRILAEKNVNKHLLKDGDVLFMSKGSRIFACPVRNLPEQTVAAGTFFIIRPDNERILSEFLAWLLNKQENQHKLLVVCGTGVTMPVIRREALEKLSIPIPSLKVQRRIVDLLALVNEEQSLINELTIQKQILIQAVCKKMTEHPK